MVQSYLDEFTNVTPHGFGLVKVKDDVQEAMLALDEGVNKERLALLARLNAGSQGPPDVVFQGLMARCANSSTRAKLYRAWHVASDAAASSRITAVDCLLRERWERSATIHLSNPLEATLTRSRVTETEAREFTSRYLVRSIENIRGLERRIASATGVSESSLAHFPHYLKQKAGGESLPVFRMHQVIEFVQHVLSSLGFDAVIVRRDDSAGWIIAVSGRTGPTQASGYLQFDVWPPRLRGRKVPADSTGGGNGKSGLTGHILARVGWSRGHAAMTFEAFQSVLHETGHALEHIFSGYRIPDNDGMGRMPLERIECSSMWWEKLAFHASVEYSFGFDGEEIHRLNLCRSIRAAEFLRSDVERAVVAAVDLEAHSRSTDLATAYQVVNREFDVRGWVPLASVPGYYTWPVFRCLPGASFLYLWGAAESSYNANQLKGRGLESLLECGVTATSTRERYQNFDERFNSVMEFYGEWEMYG
ncbi:hypothetical protein [Micrococcus luteus]|uniref:hypothetical protein n=1 Tax=Micrococcus luteus TaxID=1270 RepID=UPI00363ED7D8